MLTSSPQALTPNLATDELGVRACGSSGSMVETVRQGAKSHLIDA